MTDLAPSSSVSADEYSAEPPGWPKVIGIFSIIIGGIMSACGACGLANSLMHRAPPPDMTPPPEPPPALIALQGVGFLLALILLFGGILLVMRKPAGRTLHLVYAVLSLPLGLVGLFVQMGFIGLMQKWLHENPKLEKMSGFIMATVYLGVAIAVALMAYQVFLLIWFIAKRKADLGGGSQRDLI
jgi:hypothetical protein